MLNNDKKYYTPTIEEFHIGFECEKYHYNRDYGNLDLNLSGYEKFVVRDKFDIPLDKDSCTFYRVKYLDSEDIESLGFKYYKKGWGSGSLIFRSNRGEGLELYFRDDYPLQISKANGLILFEGFIKNKSELKKLLTQLGIC